MNVAILTSPNQWFQEYAQILSNKLNNAPIYEKHELIDEPYDVLFVLSYHKIIETEILKRHKHNIVIHGSDLPFGKGWAPLFWQVLEGKNDVVFTMFEASNGVDNGDFYMKTHLKLSGYELHDELRDKQANLMINMCVDFVDEYNFFNDPKQQKGIETFYPKRSAKDSELDIHKTIKEQFNLLRVVSNKEYPAFFVIDGQRYSIKIERTSK